MPEWLVSLLSVVGITRILKAVTRLVAWLRPVGLSRDKPLLLTVGETAYIASHPYVPERQVKDVIIQVNLGNPNPLRPKTIMTFRLKVSCKAPYPVSEARHSERADGWFLVPPSGWFSTVPTKNYVRLPITILAGEAAVGWIGFCLLERGDLTLQEAW